MRVVACSHRKSQLGRHSLPGSVNNRVHIGCSRPEIDMTWMTIMEAIRSRFPKFFLLATCLVVSGCLSGGGEETVSVNPPTNPPGNPPPGNAAPTIGGVPSSQATVGALYSFIPNASDSDGDTLSFTVNNAPNWAQFDSATGELSGVPETMDVGTYADISITVSDGSVDSSTAPFSITVNQTATGSATLSWTAPTQNVDGSPLSDLAGYNIYYGLSEGQYDNVVSVDNPGLTTFVVENLAPNTYFFVATAVNSSGVESDRSAVATKVVEVL